MWGEVKPSDMVTIGAAVEGKNDGGTGGDTMDTAVDMEEGMSVRPDLIEAVSEPLVTSKASVAIMGCLLEDDTGGPGFNIDMPRELKTLLAALRL